MTDYSQIPFGLAEFADNPEPRCPVLLLLDNSGSMSGEKIQELNAGLATFQQDLLADELAAKRCEVAIVSFGPVRTVTDFVGVEAFQAPVLEPMGDTPLGGAILHGLNLLSQRKEAIRQNGIGLYRPWVFLITDGAPTDDWKAAAKALREGVENKSFAFFAVGVQGADIHMLGQLGPREPLMLTGVKFQELFAWLSSSLKSVSQSSPGDAVSLSSPQSWASI